VPHFAAGISDPDEDPIWLTRSNVPSNQTGQRQLALHSGAGYRAMAFTLADAHPRRGRSLPKLDVAGSSPVAALWKLFA
jgi:hypothetical protein